MFTMYEIQRNGLFSEMCYGDTEEELWAEIEALRVYSRNYNGVRIQLLVKII